MTYFFGPRSRKNLINVHPDLVVIAGTALYLTSQDFAVFDGLRTVEEQEENVARGVSHTMRSAHLMQEDGHCWALDLVPYVRGRPRWEWGPSYAVARAVYAASKRHKVELRWGGVWDRPFSSLDPDNFEREVQDYVGRRQARGKDAFIDAPHYQRLEF